jgi:hypothetical protein
MELRVASSVVVTKASWFSFSISIVDSAAGATNPISVVIAVVVTSVKLSVVCSDSSSVRCCSSAEATNEADLGKEDIEEEMVMVFNRMVVMEGHEERTRVEGEEEEEEEEEFVGVGTK